MPHDDRPPTFQWCPRDFASDPGVLAMEDWQELAYRRALDASWADECYGVGSPEDWCRWGRVRGERASGFIEALRGVTVESPSGHLAQIRMARDRMEQALRYRKLGNRPQNTRGGRPVTSHQPHGDPTVAHGDPTVKPHSSASASSIESKEKTIVGRTRSGPEIEPRGFARFYEAYPRRDGRRAAAKAFASALTRHPGYTPENLFDGAVEFSRRVLESDTEPRFIPLPATWLNQDRFRELFDESDLNGGQHAVSP